MTSIVGWDIGGANLKAARAEDGRIVAVTQQPCAPHLGLAYVEQAIRAARALMGPADRHAVTMTAELSDAFEDRLHGVVSIAAIFAREIAARDIVFYAGAAGFVGQGDIAQTSHDIASANWRASAGLVARACAEALFLDMGSTTTDITPIRGGAVAALGEDDASRLAQGELVYTGLLRGSPSAGLSLAPVGGRWTALVDEQFATMADAHRILGNIPLGADVAPTVDGRAKTLEASRARLARLVGCDASDGAPEQWNALAEFFAGAQMRRIENQIALLASRSAFKEDAPIVGAGVGRGVIAAWARRTGRAYRDFDEFILATPEVRSAASDCAPACAVALLASEAPLDHK
jgi:probable H4MPT-linked C1 transfer pathway protein